MFGYTSPQKPQVPNVIIAQDCLHHLTQHLLGNVGEVGVNAEGFYIPAVMFQQITTELRWSSSPCLQGWYSPLTQKGKCVVLPSFWLHLHHQYCPDIGNAAKFKAADVIYQVVTKRSFYLLSSRHLSSQRLLFWAAKSIVCLSPKDNPLPTCTQQKNTKLRFVVHSAVIENLYRYNAKSSSVKMSWILSPKYLKN